MDIIGKENEIIANIFNQAYIGIVILSLRGKILSFNDQFSKLLGYTNEELRNQNISQFTYFKDKKAQEKNFEEIFKGKRKRIHFHHRYVHKTGKIIWNTIIASIIDNEINEPTYFFAIYDDITEKINHENRIMQTLRNFKIVVEKVPLPIIITNKKRIEFINTEAEKKFGYTLKDIPTIIDFLKVAFPDQVYREEVRNLLNKMVEDKTYRKIGSMEFYIVDKWGITKNVLISMLELANDYFLYILEDLTEKWKHEQEKIRLQKLDSLGILAGGIAHDFNNVLSGILGNISLIGFELENKSDELTELLNDLEHSVERAKSLSNQLLTFAKGGNPIKKEVNIIDLIKSSINLVLSGSKSKCILDVNGNIPYVELDPAQIQQVVNNLLINADQAMSQGGTIEIHIDLLPKNLKGEFNVFRENDFIKISIKDYGEGILKEHQTKIFTPYFTTKETGSGLGLATAYSIVKKHGGWMDFQSVPTKYTIFNIFLPVEIPKDTLEDTIENNARNKGEVEKIRPYGKILLLEDDVVIIHVMEKMFKKLNQHVVVVRDGRDAIYEYKRHLDKNDSFNLLILDLTIPGGMGGKEVMKQLLEIDPNVKAVVSSGYSNDPILSNYQKYGFQGVLTKPYTFHELQKTLRRFL